MIIIHYSDYILPVLEAFIICLSLQICNVVVKQHSNHATQKQKNQQLNTRLASNFCWM